MAWHSLGNVTVTTAGTPVRITINESSSTARLQCHAIMVEQIPGNSGRIIIGLSNLNSTTYVGALAILAIPTTNTLPSCNVGIGDAPNAFNAADYFIDATVSGEGALVSYLIT